jgi:hypothetical protein
MIHVGSTWAVRRTWFNAVALVAVAVFLGTTGSAVASASERTAAVVRAVATPHGVSSLVNVKVKTLDTGKHTFTVVATSLQTNKTTTYTVDWEKTASSQAAATMFYKGTYKTKGSASELKVGELVDVAGTIVKSTITADFITISPTI